MSNTCNIYLINPLKSTNFMCIYTFFDQNRLFLNSLNWSVGNLLPPANMVPFICLGKVCGWTTQIKKNSKYEYTDQVYLLEALLLCIFIARFRWSKCTNDTFYAKLFSAINGKPCNKRLV